MHFPEVNMKICMYMYIVTLYCKSQQTTEGLSIKTAQSIIIFKGNLSMAY